MFKIMHTADIHADTARHDTLNPNTGVGYAVESNIRCLDHLVTSALENEVDLFVLAGDVSTDGNPKPEIDMLLADTLKPLVDNGIPIEIDTGNHERLGIPSKHRTNVDVLGRMLGSSTTHVITDTTLTKYDAFETLTIPYPIKSRILAELKKTRVDPTEGDALVVKYVQEQLTRHAENRDESLPLIIAGHFTVDGIGLPGSEKDVANLFSEVVFPLEIFEQFDPAYVALGHIHTPQKLSEKVWYSGSANKLTFTDANDEKGGNLVTIADNGSVSVERILTPVRGLYKVDLRKEGVELDLSKYERLDAVQVQLPEGEVELPRDTRKKALQEGISLIPVPNPKKRKKTREILTTKVSPLDALNKYLETQDMETDEIKGAVNRAKNMGVDNTNEGEDDK